MLNPLSRHQRDRVESSKIHYLNACGKYNREK